MNSGFFTVVSLIGTLEPEASADPKAIYMTRSAIREPAVAGTFYPAEEAALRRMVDACFAECDVASAPSRVAGIVAPHAGIQYSGVTAAHAFGRCAGKKPQRVIMIGCSHHFPIRRVSVWDSGSFKTPLGTFPIDEAFARRITEKFGNETPEAHVPEHCIEMHLPFLYTSLGAVPIVPMLFGGRAGDCHHEFGRALAGMVAPEDLVVCSTDLSHFLTEEQANRIDRASLDALLKQDIGKFDGGIAQKRYAMCGATAVSVAMACALERHAESWQLLDYRTSAAVTHDTSRVVGYGAVSMERAA